MNKITRDQYENILKSRPSKSNKRNQISDRFYRCKKNIYFDNQKNQSIELYPNLIIIGSQKSGTTSLHFYLDQHPDVFMSKPIKESGFYREVKQNISYWKKKDIHIENRYTLLCNYMLQNYQGQKYIGDSSTFYTNKRFNKDQMITNNIKSFTANPKLIYLLRNPFHRLISNYLHSISRNYTNSSFAEWVLNRGKENVYTSMYYFQLEKYISVFGKNRVHVILYDNLVNNTISELKKVESFLNLKNHNTYKIKQYNKTNINITNNQKESFWVDEDLLDIKRRLTLDLKKLETELKLEIPHHFYTPNY